MVKNVVIPAIASVRRFIRQDKEHNTTNPKPFDFGSLFQPQGVPQLLRAELFVVLVYSATITTVFLTALAIICFCARSTLDLSAARPIVSPAICAWAKKYLSPYW